MKRNLKMAAAIAALLAASLTAYFYFSPGRPDKAIALGSSPTQAPIRDTAAVSTPSVSDQPPQAGGELSRFDSSSVRFAIAALLVLALSAIILAALKKRRDGLLLSPHLVTPQNFHKWTEQVAGTLESVIRATNSNSHEVRESKSNLQAAFVELSQTFLTLQRALDQRDQQLKRAEQGWELQIFKKFLLRFARVDEVLNDQTIDDASALVQARLMMRDALDECGVEPFHPRIGSDYRTERGVDDQPILTHVNDKDLYFTIKSVRSPGYCVRATNGDDVIVIPARVEVYAPQEGANA